MFVDKRGVDHATNNSRDDPLDATHTTTTNTKEVPQGCKFITILVLLYACRPFCRMARQTFRFVIRKIYKFDG